MRQAYQDVGNELYDVVLAFGVEKIPPGLIADTLVPVWMLKMGFNIPSVYGMEGDETGYVHASGCGGVVPHEIDPPLLFFSST